MAQSALGLATIIEEGSAEVISWLKKRIEIALLKRNQTVNTVYFLLLASENGRGCSYVWQGRVCPPYDDEGMRIPGVDLQSTA